MCSISLNLNAAHIIDVYGTDPFQSEDIIKHFSSQVGDIQSQFWEKTIKISNGSDEQNSMSHLLSKKNQLIDKIKNRYDFAYVELDMITYPNDDNYHTTIEVVSRRDKHRLKFIPKINKIPPTINSKPDLIDEMIEFQNKEINLFINHQYGNNKEKCPVYHCLTEFVHPSLKNTFHELVIKARQQKKFLINIANNDLSSERRSAAIYLMGYLNDPHEIISLATSHVVDNNDEVRNSAMRVIGITMSKAQIYEINVLPFINLLDSPFDTDRNKSLLILSSAANLDSSKQLIIQHADKQLIALLRLKQPNNHDFAYIILKKISNQDFGDTNIEAWEEWFKSAKKST